MDTLFIDQGTGKLVNIHAPYKGRSRLDTPEIRADVGVVEVERDTPPDEYNDHPDWYDIQEDWESTQRPYILYVRKPDAEIVELELTKKKAQRQIAVDSLKVTISTGKEFDGDETSQGRMSRAILAGQIAGITECTWVLASNVPTVVTLAELSEALAKAMQAMGAIWSEPYL